MLKKIKALPTIDYKELNDIVKFRAPQTVTADRGIAWVNTVGIIWGKNEILMETVEGSEYKPPKDIIEIFEKDFLASAQKFKPELVIVSAGFDSREKDPLGGFLITDQGFRRLTQIVKEMAKENAKGATRRPVAQIPEAHQLLPGL